MEIKSIIHSILYAVGDQGIDLFNLRKILNISIDEIRKNISEMAKNMSDDANCGTAINIFNGKYFMSTKKQNYEYLVKLLNIKNKNPLTSALLETLAIIAYNQPCTRAKVEEIRNIDPSFAFERLTELELIENIGKATTPGNPYLYQVTQKFFNIFGLKSIKDLKPLEDVDFDLSTEDIKFFDSSR